MSSKEVTKFLRELNMPLLYRHILQLAERFPSKKRASIIREIKDEFRRNKDITDEAKLMDKRRLALDSLDQLRSYAGLASSKGDYSLFLSGNVMKS